MKVAKKIIDSMEKCYSITFLNYQGSGHFLVATEKAGPCNIYSLDGERVSTVWNEPGGVMSMVAYGQGFLATQKFFSPNDSAQARIVYASPLADGTWSVNCVAELPFVHRFDVLERDGRKYLVACTIKSEHLHKDDWSSPGRIYSAELPEDVSCFSEEKQLKLEVIKDGLFRNHGYSRTMNEGKCCALVASDQGIFRLTPPAAEGDWEIEQLLDLAASDAVIMDIDGDGQDELFVMRPFHGDTVEVYKGGEKVFEWQQEGAFLHAIWPAVISERQSVVFGCRGGSRDLLLLSYDDGYNIETIDRDCGSANVNHYQNEGRDYIISANREKNEVALYVISQ